MKRKTEQILSYLRNHPDATNGSIAKDLDFEKDFVTKQISLFKARSWIRVLEVNGQRCIEVTKEDPEGMVEYKKEIYTEMLPILLSDFEKVTNIQDRSLVAKLIFRVLDNL